VHRVTVAPFYLARYEVTYAQHDAFAKATGRPLPEDDGFGRGEWLKVSRLRGFL
jgi:formylglycine-generating enzyme required for sulfatase activity